MALTLNNLAVQSFIAYSAILALKMLLLGALTATLRLIRRTFANPEDMKLLGGKVKLDDPVVERVRRAHRNDLENVPAFWILGALYLTTGPSEQWAVTMFRVFVGARLFHGLFAVVPLPKMARSYSFRLALSVLMYMGAHVVVYYANRF